MFAKKKKKQISLISIKLFEWVMVVLVTLYATVNKNELVETAN